jgi:hypothetical protein
MIRSNTMAGTRRVPVEGILFSTCTPRCAHKLMGGWAGQGSCMAWLSHLHLSSPPADPTTVVKVMGPMESKLAMLSRRGGRLAFLSCSLRVMGPMTCVPSEFFSVLRIQDPTLLETLQKPACRNLLTAGSVTTMLLAVSSAQDQTKAGARVRVMSRWSLNLVRVGARTEAIPIVLVEGENISLRQFRCGDDGTLGK